MTFVQAKSLLTYVPNEYAAIDKFVLENEEAIYEVTGLRAEPTPTGCLFLLQVYANTLARTVGEQTPTQIAPSLPQQTAAKSPMFSKLVSVELKKWYTQLKNCKPGKGYTLHVYPLAGPEHRNPGTWCKFTLGSLRTYGTYLSTYTTLWFPVSKHASSQEELVPPNYQLLWLAGITFFILRDGRSLPANCSEDKFQRPLPDPTGRGTVRFVEKAIDFSRTEQVNALYKISLTICHDRLRNVDVKPVMARLNAAVENGLEAALVTEVFNRQIMRARLARVDMFPFNA